MASSDESTPADTSVSSGAGPGRKASIGDLVGILEGARTVLAGTDDGDEPAFSHERDVAADLAAALGARLVLFDRSRETWGDSDYNQLYGIDQVEDAGRPHLVRQMQSALEAGVPEVLAWGYALPALESLGRAIDETEADVVVTPERLESPSLAERWLINRDLPARVQEQARGRKVVVVGTAGDLWLNDSGGDSSSGHGTEGGRPAPDHVS